jgi:hypothetical protein
VKMYEDSHYFPTFDRTTNESTIPMVAFIAKKIIALKRSFETSNDVKERCEIQATLIFYQSALLLLCLSYLTEEDELTDLAKEIFRN